MAILNHGSTLRTADGGQTTTTIVTAANIGTYGVATNATYYVGTTQNVFNRASGAQTLTGVSIDGNAANITAYTINQNVGTANAPSFAGMTSTAMLVSSTSMSSNDDWSNSPISIRERGLVSAAQSINAYSPNINFHWASRISNSLWMDANGNLAWGSYSETGVPSSDGAFYAANLYASIYYDKNDTAYYLDAGNTGTSLLVAGNVGIGITSPSAKLHIYNGSSHFETTSTGAAVISSGLYALQIAPLRGRITTAGSYYGGIAFNHLLNISGTTTYNGAPQAWIGTRLQDTAGSERDYLVFATKPGTGVTGTGNDIPIERMCIDRDGLVGIGTTSPLSTLSLSGAGPTILTLATTSYPSTYLTSLGVDTSARGFLIFGNNGENQVRAGRTSTGGYLDFYTNNTVDQTTLASNGNFVMRLAASGSVGIGTTTPSQKLDVSGAINASTYVYAGVFYDNDNTVYNTNPSGTSNLLGLTVANTITGSISGSSASCTGNAATATNGLTTSNYVSYSAFTGSVTSTYGNFTTPALIMGDAQYGFYVVSGNVYYKSASGGVHYWRNTANSGNTMSLDNSGNLNVSGYLQTTGNLIYPSTYGVTQRLEVSNAANNAWIDGLTIAPGGIVTAYGDSRAPIFYDSNDTAYYVNPNSSSNLSILRVFSAFDTASSDVYANMRVMRNNATNDGMYIGYGNLGSTGGITRIFGGGATTGELAKYIDYTLEPNSFRAPIFYDSNDTAYYTDPNGTSVLNRLKIDGGNFAFDYFQSLSDFVNGTLVTTDIPASAANGLSFVMNVIGKSYNTATSPFDFNVQGYLYNSTIINYSGMSLDSTGLSTIKVFENGGFLCFWWARVSYWNAFEVNVRSYDAAKTNYNRVTNITDVVEPTGTKKVTVTLHRFMRADASATNSVDLRAPIFYDSNDTAYYTDPSSLSNILELKTNKNWYDSSASAWGGGINMGGNSPSIGFQSTASTWWYMLHHSANDINFYRRSTSGGWNQDAIWHDAGHLEWITDSVRAAVFYDRNDTTYYTDPASTSVLYNLTLSGAKHTYLYINPGNPYEAMVRFNGGSGSSWYIGKRNASQLVGTESFHFYSEAALVTVGGIDTSGNIFSTGSVRSPIFYDSNDTNYYVDPASTSILNGTRHNTVVAGSTSAMTSAGQLAIYSSANPYISFHDGGVGRTAYMQETGGRFYFGEVTYTESEGSFRAPLFYDTNNTAYYVDPASTSVMNQINLAGILRRTASAAGYLEGNYPTGVDGNSSSVIYTIGGAYQPAATNLGNMYGCGYTVGNGTANPGLGASGWGFYVASGGTSRIFLDSDVGYGIASNSWRAPIFYDSNDTAYYLDPRSTSVLSGLKLNGIDNEAAGTGSDAILWINKPNNNDWAIRVSGNLEYLLKLEGATSHTYNIQGMANGSEFWRCGTDLLYHNSNIRAPIFYDSANTAYYINPDGVSNLVGLTVVNQITGSISGNAGGSSASCTGNAATVTGITNQSSGNTDLNTLTTSGFYRLSNAAPNDPTSNKYGQLLVIHAGSDTITQILGDYGTGNLWTRGGNPTNVGGGGAWTSWKLVLDSVNYTSYAPTLTGSGASGTWSINVTGNASGTAASISGFNNPTTAATANTIVYRDGSGHIIGNYIFSSYFNASAGNSENPTIGQIWTQNTTDNYLRKSTPAHFRSQVTDGSYPSLTGANASGTWSINVTGNAGGSSASCTGNSATTTLATKATRANGNFYIDDNYGNTVVGVYSATRLQGVFAMGDSYKLTADGTGAGTLYGLAWSHPNFGGVAANLADHGLLILQNGVFKGAWGGGSLRTPGDVRGTLFYDWDNTGYYCDPASTSNLNAITAAGSVTAANYYTGGWFRNNASGNGLYNEATGQHFYSDSANYWNVASSASAQGIRLRTGGHAGTVRGYFYADTNNDVGFLNQDGSWRLRVVGGDYSLADGSSMRAQIFYDSNNTGYYVDPASTSNINGLTAASNITVNGISIGKGTNNIATNTAVGVNALSSNTTGSLNSAFGKDALTANTFGYGNSAFGIEALASNSSGNYNTAFGRRALYLNTIGNQNTAVGQQALAANTTGICNTAVGFQALLSSTTGANNTAVGRRALHYLASGVRNCAFGTYTLQYANGTNNNAAFGTYALQSLTTGANNSAFGYKAGYNISSGSNNTVIGNSSNPSTGGVSNEFTLGNASIATLRCAATSISSLSDLRDKADIEDINIGISFVEKIRPVTFKWDKREWYANGNRDGTKKDLTVQSGFIAQDLKKLQEEFGVEFLKLAYESNPEKLEATPANLLIPLIKAMQELNEKVKTLENKVRILENR